MKKLPVLYTPRLVADSGAFSPSAGKPAAVMAAWLEMALPTEVIEPEPATEAQLAAVHDFAYVRGVHGRGGGAPRGREREQGRGESIWTPTSPTGPRTSSTANKRYSQRRRGRPCTKKSWSCWDTPMRGSPPW